MLYGERSGKGMSLMNLQMKIHPVLAGLVVALAVVAVAMKFWGEGEALKYGGPSQLLRDPHGHLYIQIQNLLLEHNADGAFIRGHDLADFGVQTMIGAMAFFSNGDALLRRGEDRRNIANRIAAYQRRENTSDLIPESPGAGLARCSLQTKQCAPFAEPPIDFKSTIGVYIDWRNDDVYISDTSRHTLHKYSRNGVALAEPKRGFKFPNQILLHDEQLIVTDTNHHQVRVVDPRSEYFAKTIRSIGVVPEQARQADLRWPSHLARIGDEWWVNNMNGSMRNGGIYVFDKDWQYLRRIPLPENADPISILPFATGALISDWDNDRVYRVAKSGTVLDDFSSSGLEAVLQESRKSRSFYRALSWMGIMLLGVVFIGLITKAIASPASEVAAVPVDDDKPAYIGSVELIWFEPDPKVVRKIRLNNKLAGGMIAAAVSMLVLTAAAHDNGLFAIKMLPLVGSLVVIYALIYWMSHSNIGTAVGFEGDDIILRDHKGVESRFPLKKVVYDKVAIATPDMAVVLGHRPVPIYEPDIVAEQILPRLAAAKAISAVNMQRMLIRLRHPHGVMLLLAVIVFAVAAVWHLFD